MTTCGVCVFLVLELFTLPDYKTATTGHVSAPVIDYLQRNYFAFSANHTRNLRLSNNTRELLAYQLSKPSPTINSCKPRKNIAFLKVHKTGSSTMMTMFYRFAAKYHLNIVLPNTTSGNFNYLGYGRTLNPSTLIKLPYGEEYNIICNHVVYNRTTFKAIMPNDTINIGIVRDPVTNFISALSYFGGLEELQSQTLKKLGTPLPERSLIKMFLQRPETFETSVFQHYVHNIMSFDFGLRPEDYDDEEAIDRFIDGLHNDFVLVIILEYLNESLVLMKRILCWDFKDILYIPVNVRISQSFRETLKLNDESVKRLNKFNKADFKLYSFFKSRLLAQIKQLGYDFKLEVKHFKKVQSQLLTFCSRYPRLNLTVQASQWHDEFTVTSAECDYMMTDELMLVRDQIIKSIDRYEIWKRRMHNVRGK